MWLFLDKTLERLAQERSVSGALIWSAPGYGCSRQFTIIITLSPDVHFNLNDFVNSGVTLSECQELPMQRDSELWDMRQTDFISVCFSGP